MESDTTVSPAVEKKAMQYLAESKIRVVEVSGNSAQLTAKGTGLYLIRFQGGVWVCDCPARVALCAHIVAAKKIVHFKTQRPVLPHADADDLDALLGDRREQQEQPDFDIDSLLR